MSYILNALRKSEKERRATQSSKLEIGTLESTTPKKKWVPWFLFVLLFVNIVTVAYFAWFQPKNIASPTLAIADEIDHSGDHPESENPHFSNANKQQGLQANSLTPVANRIEAKNSDVKLKNSISEMVKSRQKRPKPSVNTDLSDVNLGEIDSDTAQKFRQIVAEAVNRPEVGENETKMLEQFLEKINAKSASQSQPDHHEERDFEKEALAKIEKQSAKASRRIIRKPRKKRRKKKSDGDEQAKLLKDMPPEFRRTVPEFNINVFVYDEDPDERFVIIDMNKFKETQTIAEGLTLEKILPDSLLVRYRNKNFRIKRP